MVEAIDLLSVVKYTLEQVKSIGKFKNRELSWTGHPKVQTKTS